MNLSTLIGLLSGIAVVVLSIVLSANDAGSFLDFPGLVIVLGGTVAATLLSYPLREVLNVFKTFIIILRNEKLYAEDDQRELVQTARMLLEGRLRDVEAHVTELKNPFLQTGIQMLVDNTPTEDIADMLQWRITRLSMRERAEAQIYRTMAMYAPAFGMLGTLVGLVNMLQGMGADDMGQIGTNMALALVTTLYGVALANLLLKPIAIKFERRTEMRVQLMTMIMEGVLLLSKGRRPAYIREYLSTFFAHIDDELHDYANRVNDGDPALELDDKLAQARGVQE